MKRKFHVRFGERGGEIHGVKAPHGVPASTLRDPSPSSEDVTVTRAVIEAGKLLDIACIDHVIVGGMRHVSLKERGLGFG